MKPAKFFWVISLSLFFLIAACEDEKAKNDYSGVSNLIAERNKARLQAANKTSPKKNITSTESLTGKTHMPKPISSPDKKKELSTIIIYEEAVEIVASKSGQTLAKAVASINKQGQIVKIRIVKE